MPGKFIENYNHVPETKEDRQSLYSMIVFVLLIWPWVLVDYAELITLDLELYEQPGGKEKLVKQLDHAVRNVGESIVDLK